MFLTSCLGDTSQQPHVGWFARPVPAAAAGSTLWCRTSTCRHAALLPRGDVICPARAELIKGTIQEMRWCHAVVFAFSVFRELKEFVSFCELRNMQLLKYPSRASLGFAGEIAVKINRNRE